MKRAFLDFEQPIVELEAKIEELRLVGGDTSLNLNEEIQRLNLKSKELTKSVFKNLSAWQISQLARHPERPYTLDYLSTVFSDFDELHGDRLFGDDKAIVGGLARLGSHSVMVIGHQKGRDTKERMKRNFGSPHPEGYRKARRLMELAERFKIPVITLIDTPGAYPGIEAEARGQSEAIAYNLRLMSGLAVPIISVVIGEGASGGALGIGVGDRVLMLQYSYYATISPEGCATILFKSSDRAQEAAEIMGITADRLLSLGLIDGIIAEPLGGAHRSPELMANTLKSTLIAELENLKKIPSVTLLQKRYDRLMAMGTH
jgi:acetyl-CoA carboxylase carboxyl transferase subunit alpha